MISRTTAAAVLFAVAAAASASAQTSADLIPDSAIDQLRKDARMEKTDIITGTMEFTSAEAAKFWPLYKAYEIKRRAIGDEQVALIKEYVAHYETMTDAKATELTTRVMAVEDKQLAAKHAFVKEVQKALSPKTAARFYQVENRIELLVALELASQLPVIKK